MKKIRLLIPLLLFIAHLNAMVISVKNDNGQLEVHSINLPVEMHLEILGHVMKGSSADMSEGLIKNPINDYEKDINRRAMYCKNMEAIGYKTIRVWARVNKHCYGVINDEHATRWILNGLSSLSGQWQGRIAAGLRTQGAGQWLANYLLHSQKKQARFHVSSVIVVCKEDCGTRVLFALRAIPALRADRDFLNKALSHVMDYRKVYDPELSSASLSAAVRRLKVAQKVAICLSGEPNFGY